MKKKLIGILISCCLALSLALFTRQLYNYGFKRTIYLLRSYYYPRWYLNRYNPFISSYYFRALSDHLYDSTINTLACKQIKKGDIIYVENLDSFFKTAYPTITQPFILIHFGCDDSSPDRYWPYLKDDKIIAWFATNTDASPLEKNNASAYCYKLHPLPIGLISQYHSFGTYRNANKKLALLAHSYRQKTRRTDALVYLNFDPKSSPERTGAFALLHDKEFCFVASRLPFLSFLDEMSHFKFVLSPRGFGTDCYRTWEAVLLGTIPIVKHSSLDQLYEQFPILIINEWSDLTRADLEKKYTEIKAKRYNTDAMLHMHYWRDKIYAVQNKFRSQ
jgi:hypothetical protein